MIHSRIDSNTLKDRLDASYYTPEVLENEAQLRARGATALRALIDTDASNYGVLPPSEDYLPSGSGVPLIRGGDLGGGAIRDPEVDAPLSFKNARGTANAGDVLLLIKGACIDSPAGVGLVSERHAGSVFNGSCYRVKVAPACDAGYLVAYCQTRQLLLQKKREIANTGIAYNAEDSVLGYLVPDLSLDAQRYIGDKVRQAERLRQRARELMSVARYLAEEVALGVFDAVSLPRLEHALAKDRRRGIIAYARESTNRIRLQKPAHLDPTSAFASVDSRRDTYHVNRVKAADLGVRLLAQAHRPDIIAAVNGLRGRGGVRLATILDGPLSQGLTPEYGSDGLVCIKTRNVVGGFTDLSDSDRVSSRFAANNAKSTIGRNTVLVNGRARAAWAAPRFTSATMKCLRMRRCSASECCIPMTLRM
jgi:hypothetical protein